MTFQAWVADLIEQRFGTATELARRVGMQLSPFTRGVAAGKLNLVNLLKLAQVADANPSVVLRLAGKSTEADLIEQTYGSPEKAITASEREVLDHWRQLSPAARVGWLTFVRETQPPQQKALDRPATNLHSRMITLDDAEPQAKEFHMKRKEPSEPRKKAR